MLCRPLGFPALNQKDLVADGDIAPELSKVLDSAPTDSDIENALPGQNYVFIPDEEGDLERNGVKGFWVENRRIFPAEKMQVEIQFRNTVQSNNETIGQVNDSNFTGIGGGAIGLGAGSSLIQSALNRNTGGLSAGTTRFALDVVESKTKFNIRKTITSEIKRTGIIELNDYVHAIFAVTREPQPFTDELKDTIGKDSDRIAHGGIRGNPDDRGQARVDAISELYEAEPQNNLTAEDVFNSKNQFEEIVYDNRAHFFQADNDTNEEYNYAWRYVRHNDLTSKQIRIDTDTFRVGDPVYITGSFVQKHNLRQIIKHKGILFDSSTLGAATPQIDFLGFQLQAYNFHFVKTRIPSGASAGILFNRVNGTYNTNFDEVEGWRLTELVDKDRKDFYAADSRGIHLISDDEVVNTYISGSSLKGQEWWESFLDSSGYRTRNVTRNLGEIDYTGLMFDVSEHVNSSIIDQDKIGYHRPFALALMNAAETVGIPNLDLIRRQVIGRSDYDLSSAEFLTVNQLSYFPTGYGGSTCGGLGEAGYYDPSDPFNTGNIASGSIGIPNPPGDLATDWLLRIPLWTGKFGKDTRVHVEWFSPDRIDALGAGYSLVFIYTIPVLEAALSIDWNHYGTTAIMGYKDDKTGYLSFHRFDSGLLGDHMARTEVSPELNHEKPLFDPSTYQVIGYNRLLGCAPSYSNGQIISNDYLNICNQIVPIEDIYADEEFFRLGVDPEQEISIGGRLVRDIELNYEVYAPLQSGDDPYVSIYFEDNDLSIDNINLPIGERGSERVIGIDGKFYGGNTLKLLGDKINRVNFRSIKLKTAEESVISPYLFEGSYTSTIFDDQNKVYVFFENEETQNIDVAISEDEGRNWYVLKGIIRLLEGETADLPTAIRMSDANSLYLFYRLNENTLASKVLNFNWFSPFDVLVEYNKPSNFDTDDDLESFTGEGQRLRSEPAFFIVGDGEGNAEFNFEEASYTVYMESSGILRIMYSQEGVVHILSGSGIAWNFEARNVSIHKNLLTDSADNSDIGVENPSVFFDRYGGFIYLMYFHDEALFMRIFSPGSLKNLSGDNQLNVTGEGEAVYSSENIRDAYELPSGGDSTPYFLVGTMPQDIQEKLVSGDPDEIDQILPRINFFADTESIASQFSEGFEININTKPVGYVANDGKIRIFYKNSNDEVCGLFFSGGNTVLDVQRQVIND